MASMEMRRVVKCAHCSRLMALGDNCPSCGPGPVEDLPLRPDPVGRWELTSTDRTWLRTNRIDPEEDKTPYPGEVTEGD